MPQYSEQIIMVMKAKCSQNKQYGQVIEKRKNWILMNSSVLIVDWIHWIPMGSNVLPEDF